MIEGRLRYCNEDSGEETFVTPEAPWVIKPRELHHVEPDGAMRMQVEFYDHEPRLN